MLTGPLSILAAALAALGVFLALGLEPSQDADHPPRPAPRAGVMEDAGGRVVGDLSLEGIGVAVDRIISYAVAIDAAKKAQEAQEVARLEAVAVAEHAAEHEREAATQVVADVARESAPVAPATTGSGCVLPGDICERESGGSYTARNAGSGACGMYQVLGSTWAGYGGYGSACDAPAAVQDEFAAQLWDGGAGCGHWSAC